MADIVSIAAPKLQALVDDIFAAAGCPRAESAEIARHLVGSNLAGHDSHGVVRVPRYVSWLKDGEIHAGRTPEVVVDTPVIAVLDARYGFGQTAAAAAVAVGIDKCRAMGLAAVALRNAGHVGRIGDWAEQAAAAGLVSIHFVNAAGSVLVAPFGGVERRFSTAPHAIGIPRAGADPLILDFATSIVAEGKVLVASQGGKPIPADALVDTDGTLSNDPHVLYGPYGENGQRDHRQGQGAIRAFGEHKGSGLAFMCEVLGGALTGTGATSADRRFANGMLSFYVDPVRFDPAGLFGGEVARWTDWVKSSRPIEPGGEVLVPGEPEARTRAERLRSGVPLPVATWDSIVTTARATGLGEERIAAARA